MDPIQNGDLINNPDAARLIYGLRDTGYNVNTASADIVDNSIAANADKINIEVILHTNGRKFVYFGDNGDGMDAEGVYKAMRYGAPERENPESLGKFGLGLKTASSAICLKYSLISRKSANMPLAKLSWDLQHVEAENKWEMIQDPVTQDEQEWFEELCGEKGTLVVWEKCDRILAKHYEPGSTNEQNAIKRRAENIAKHLSLVFHRFLDTNDDRERNVEITVNKEKVAPWNPLFPARSEQVLPEKHQKLTIILPDDSEKAATIRAWILPHGRDLTDGEKDLARISNRAQGFYVYREGRLIQDGGWLGVFGVPEPHTSLLRIEFDFGHELDEAFMIDVKKSRILFDPGLEEALKKILQPIYREAGNRYRRKNREETNSNGIDHTSANKNIESTTNTTKPQVNSADSTTQSVVISNNQGQKIRIKQPVQNNVNSATIHVEAVDTIMTGDLWQPAYRSVGDAGHVPGVIINKHHDFYQKIYQRAAGSGFAVEGMDLLLWAFAMAEQNNTTPELEPIFEDIRGEISTNLKRLLRELPDPLPGELTQDDDE